MNAWWEDVEMNAWWEDDEGFVGYEGGKERKGFGG